MNRKSAVSAESDDSSSDWDTTVAESPTFIRHSKASAPTAFRADMNSDYATITPKSRRINFKDPEESESSSDGTVEGRVTKDLPRQEISQSKSGSQLMSPPPHLTSFQTALTDYTIVHDAVSEVPKRSYEGKGKLYTVPETDSPDIPQPSIANWDDSDAEEQVLKELQKNIQKEKQRHQVAMPREKRVKLAGVEKITSSVDNHGYMASPGETKQAEPVIEKWTRTDEIKHGKSQNKNQKSILASGDIGSKLHFQPPNRAYVTTAPLAVNDASGKRLVFYFMEGSSHFVEVEESNVNAYLPAKSDEIEKLFRRVWREVFAVVHIVTSIFILFITELILFLAHHIVRPLVLDSIAAVGDFVLKPLLAQLFNAVIQPAFALTWNIFNAFSQACEPLVKLLGNIFVQVSILLKAFRLFVIQWNSRSAGYRHEMEVI